MAASSSRMEGGGAIGGGEGGSAADLRGPHFKRTKQPKKEEKEVKKLLDRFKIRKNFLAIDTTEENSRQGEQRWRDARLAKITGTGAQQVMKFDGKKWIPAFKQVFQLGKSRTTGPMAIGIITEKDSIAKFQAAYFEDTSADPQKRILTLDRINLLPHKKYPLSGESPPPYLVASPDGVGKFVNGQTFIVEVKSSKSSISLVKHYDQIQLNMYLSGAKLAFLVRRHITEIAPEHPKHVTYEEVSFDEHWLATFLDKAKDYYNKYIKWWYEGNEEKGKELLAVIVEKKPSSTTIALNSRPKKKQKQRDEQAQKRAETQLAAWAKESR